MKFVVSPSTTSGGRFTVEIRLANLGWRMEGLCATFDRLSNRNGLPRAHHGRRGPAADPELFASAPAERAAAPEAF